MQRLHIRNTAHVVFSRKDPRGNVGDCSCTRSLGRTVKYLRLRDVHHQMWRTKVFSRLERTQTPGRENSKSHRVAMTGDSGRGGSSGIRRRDRDARSARSYTSILSREPRPAQHGRNCDKSLTETAAIVTHCMFLLPLGGLSRRNKQDKEYRSALGLHKVVSQPFRGSVQYYYHFIYDSRSKALL